MKRVRGVVGVGVDKQYNEWGLNYFLSQKCLSPHEIWRGSPAALWPSLFDVIKKSDFLIIFSALVNQGEKTSINFVNKKTMLFSFFNDLP